MARSSITRPSRLILGLMAATLLAACKENTGTKVATGGDSIRQQSAKLVNDAVGPAAPVAGAKPGGTITVFYLADFEHIDPAQNYVSDQAVAAWEFQRTLTQFREHPDGTFELVGDLATNTGVSNDGGLTWTFTLRDGVKYEDGRPITSQDIAYEVARSFSPDLPHGAHYVQQWLADDLDYNKVYKGPYNGAAPMPPGVETPDAKTIVFHFKKPHADMPFAAALSMMAPVPKDKDTKVQYDNRPFSSGPYKIDSYQRGQQLTLVKNTQWDPATDPMRHQYPDTIRFVFINNNVQINERVLSGQGADASALTWTIVPQEVLPKVLGDSAAMRRIVRGYSQYTRYLAINTQRVTDLKVRQALNFAIDRENFIKAYTGPLGADPSTTNLSPTIAGYLKFNAYDGGPNGNIQKAKELLAGQTPSLVLAYPNTPRFQKSAAFLQSNFEQAGFKITIQPVDGDQYYTDIGRKDNPFDLYVSGWGSDWPSGSTVIPPLFDGRTIQPAGNQNTSFLNAPEINAKIDSIGAITDLARAAPLWGQLDKYLMETYAPVIPMTYEKWFSLLGPNVGGAFLSPTQGIPALWDVYVK